MIRLRRFRPLVLPLLLAACSQLGPEQLSNPATAPLAVGDVSRTNIEDATPDNSSVTRSVTFGAEDVREGAVVNDVAVALKFGHNYYTGDIYYVLTSPSGTQVVLVQDVMGKAGSGQSTTYKGAIPTPGEITVVFSDAGPVQNSATPVSGTFQPRQPLSAFKGEPVVGDWILTVGDAFPGDGTLAHGEFTLTLNTRIPEMSPPAVSFLAPAEGAAYGIGEVVTADYSCADEVEGSGLKGCVGTLASGAALDTSTPGSYSFTVDAEDNDGNKTSLTHTYTVAKTAPVISFGATPTVGERGSTAEVAVTSSSDAAPTLSAAPETVCTLVDKTLSLVAVGDCTVTASQPETANFTAGSAAHTVKVVRTLTPTRTSAVSGSSVYGGAATLSATLTGADGAPLAGQPLSFEVVVLPVPEVGSAVTDANGVATLSGVDLQGLGAGTHPVIVTFAGDDTAGLEASHALGEVTVAQAAQSVSFSSAPPNPATVGGFYTALVSASSSLPVTLVSDTPGVCTLSGTTAAFVGAGSCVLNASQAGDANVAAASAQQSFAVATPAPVAIADTYRLDFETAPANRLVYSVGLGSGMVRLSGDDPYAGTVPVVGKRRVGSSIDPAHLARVVSLYGSKRLVIASPNSNTPAPTGGRVKLSFTNIDPKGVTLTSLTLSNLTTKGAYLTFYYADGRSSQQNLGTTRAGASLVVALNVPSLRAVDVFAPSAFAVDDVTFVDAP